MSTILILLAGGLIGVFLLWLYIVTSARPW